MFNGADPNFLRRLLGMLAEDGSSMQPEDYPDQVSRQRGMGVGQMEPPNALAAMMADAPPSYADQAGRAMDRWDRQSDPVPPMTQPQNALAMMARAAAPDVPNRLVAEPGINGDFQVYPGAGNPKNVTIRDADVNRMRAEMGQGQGQASQGMRVVGYGDGSVTDMGMRNEAAPALDYSRGKASIPGIGDGYYSKDGRSAIVTNADGSKTKVILGYDRAGSMALQKNDRDIDKAAADLEQSRATTEHTREATAASFAARTQKEGLPGMGIPQSVLEKQFGKAPDGKRWSIVNGQGVLEDVPGGDGGKLNESQGKAAGMASRAIAAHQILLDMEKAGVTTPSLIKQGVESVPIIGNALGMAANKFASVDQRKVEQAQRDFVNAVLRPESGASISASEFDNARKQYFPQPNDDADTIRQKQEAREREINALAIMSGPSGAAQSRKANAAPAGGADRARALFDAKAAIAKGAPASSVRARLASMGITDSGI